jgi:hypothetical protein
MFAISGNKAQVKKYPSIKKLKKSKAIPVTGRGGL